MPEAGAFRQVDEKHVSAEVDLMVWSPKFDLVALSNVQGEVILHRLSWQKVWTLPPLREEVKVKAMSWRSDGKVLAVGYSTGQVNLTYIENAEVLHTFTLEGEITCLSWVCQLVPKGQSWSCDPYPEDNSDLYLPRLQPLNKSYGTLTKGMVDDHVEDKKKLKEQKELNILIVGCHGHQLHLYIYGVFPVAKVTIGEQNGSEPQKIHSATVSSDLNSLIVFLELGKEGCQELEHTLITFDTKLLSSRDKELHLLALKYGQVATLVDYLQNTIQQMTEAWEDILLEMDSKLYNFAEEKQKTGSGTVSNDFLELLLFGTPSPELQTFLQNDLTDKGLKKLGHSIETSYSNIQQLVVKHLQTVSQAILYHISELKGMSRNYEKFGVLGLDQKSLHESLMTAGSFVLKTSELQQVIDGSIKNFKAFFRWLYVVILRLSPDKPPPELSKMTQHDINFVAEFLRDSFAQFTPKEEAESIDDLRAVSPTDKRPGFKLEKVGQYLKKEDLHYPPDISGNPWIQFCRASHTLKDSTVLYPIENNKSLIQLQESLENVITTSLTKPAMTIGQSVEPVSSLYLFSCPKCDEEGKPFIPKVRQFTVNEPSLLYTVFTCDCVPADRMFILRQPTDCHRISGNIEITSVKFGAINRVDPDTSVGSQSGR